jgi:hypothetical protein
LGAEAEALCVVVVVSPPQWSVLDSWLRPELVRVEPLDLDHPAILDSAKALQRIVM